MACEPSYTVCISQRSGSGAGSELAAAQSVTPDRRCLLAGLDRSGQTALTGLYTLSNHCYTAGNDADGTTR